MNPQKFDYAPAMGPRKDSREKMKKFIKYIEEKHDLKFGDYWEFHKWTVEHIDKLWGDLWDHVGVIYSKPYDKVIDLSIPMKDNPKWFEGARLNIAENLLKYRDDHVALILAGEDKDVEKLTYKEMFDETKLYASSLKQMGLKRGDVVTCYMSNRKEAVIAMLATTSIGAVWTGGLPLLGPKAYLNRVKQVKPKVLFTIDQFTHNKEKKHLLQNIKEIADGLTTLEKVVIVGSEPQSKQKDISAIKKSCFLDDFLQTGYNAEGSVPDVVFEQVSFSHPAFISYTSGTTGLPKTIVHGFGGLLPAVRDYLLHWDTDRSDTWLSMSPVGWVSWNMINHVLFLGQTIVLFEGVPYFLSPTHLWDMVDDLKISAIFITPSAVDELESRGYVPTEKHSLSSLRMFLVGSSVVKPNNFDFVQNKIKKDIFSVGCGCTEIMAFHLVTESTIPYYKGEISSPALGIAVECLDEAGNPVIGEMGELVFVKSVPSFPIGLWGDDDGKVYKKAYFSIHPEKFAIGDSAIINPFTKGIIVRGRSDETLKPKGCRFGSSEIYNIVEPIPEIRDSICVAQYRKDMVERAVLFLKMREGYSLTEDILKRLEQTIAKELSVAHVPEVILQAPDIPYNVNGKKMEIIVKKIINKMPHNPETVANSECLKFYYDVPELRYY